MTTHEQLAADKLAPRLRGLSRDEIEKCHYEVPKGIKLRLTLPSIAGSASIPSKGANVFEIISRGKIRELGLVAVFEMVSSTAIALRLYIALLRDRMQHCFQGGLCSGQFMDSQRFDVSYLNVRRDHEVAFRKFILAFSYYAMLSSTPSSLQFAIGNESFSAVRMGAVLKIQICPNCSQICPNMPEAHQYLNRVDFRGEAPPSGGTFQVAVDPFSVLPLLRHLHRSIFSANISTPPKSSTRRSLQPADVSTPPTHPPRRYVHILDPPLQCPLTTPPPRILHSSNPPTPPPPRLLVRCSAETATPCEMQPPGATRTGTTDYDDGHGNAYEEDERGHERGGDEDGSGGERGQEWYFSARTFTAIEFGTQHSTLQRQEDGRHLPPSSARRLASKHKSIIPKLGESTANVLQKRQLFVASRDGEAPPYWRAGPRRAVSRRSVGRLLVGLVAANEAGSGACRWLEEPSARSLRTRTGRIKAIVFLPQVYAMLHSNPGGAYLRPPKHAAPTKRRPDD
ncbi:uncharacterized protein MYCGRDRAFT_111771 [Zymoseptoria tritici IPO323]|uniref:Uncharacterized protein n=1 Tax=Zymoseptoria tritici (strain CBS 115943 / IPO323) TaxID=336722 RepID=F9XRN7_ZYMTI|nr:uncharacterized protein MYCGRDRAFT_111771 [Zymoseptoria tritici IPO323]EGP82096.1 hypothetical protein MYCGRDRAFT_111771 [Zymoseptoria tritici IPO323]